MPENGEGDKGAEEQGAGDRGTGDRRAGYRRTGEQEAGDKGDRWQVEGSRPREQGIWLSQHQKQNSVARNIAKFIT